MELNDYKNDLNNIKCSDEFKVRMTRLLSEEPDTEYADSVSHVEPARKMSFTNFAAMAAAAVLAVGLGGALVMNLKNNGPDPLDQSVVDEMTSVRASFSVNSCFTNEDGENYYCTTNIPELPEYVVLDKIFPYISSNYNTVEAVPKEMLSSSNDNIVFEFSGTKGQLNLDFIEDKPFTYTVCKNGLSYFTQDDISTYFMQPAPYNDMLYFVACAAPDYDWSSLHGVPEVGQLFDEYRDQITICDDDDGHVFMTTAYLFGEDGFDVMISLDEEMCVAYYDSDGNERRVLFKTPDGFCAKLRSAIFADAEGGPYDDETIPPVEASELGSYLSSIWMGTDGHLCLSYLDNGSQTGDMTDLRYIKDYSSIIDAINSTSWTIAEPVNPENAEYSDYYTEIYHDAFYIYPMFFTKNGNIYDTSTCTKYVPDDKSGKLTNAIKELINEDDAAKVSYLIASSVNRYKTMSGDISCISYFDMDIYTDASDDENTDISNNVNGIGNIYLSNDYNSEISHYINLKDGETGYSAELIESCGLWTLLKHGSDLTSRYPDNEFAEGANGEALYALSGSKFYGCPIIKYDTLRSNLLAELEAALHKDDAAYMGDGRNIDVAKFEIEDNLSEEGFIKVSLVYSEDGDNTKAVNTNFTIDSMGTFTSVYFYRENYSNNQNDYVNMNISNIKYDSADFAFPELTEEQREYLSAVQ